MRYLLALPLALSACVPSGSSQPSDGGTTHAQQAPTFHPSANVMTAAFEDSFERTPSAAAATATAPAPSGSTAEVPASSSSTGASTTPSTLAPVADLGPDWVQIATSAWRIENGKLCGQNAHNHPVWLKRVLPVNARIEFDAVSESQDGDLKAEFWGDGKSFAQSVSYTNATSYLTIFGGWKNKFHVLARLDEHAKNREYIDIVAGSDDPKQRPVVTGQTYHFKVERTDGKTVRWFVDNEEYLTWKDNQPLAGEGHDHFGFNDWEAKVCFDHVKVTPLP